MCLMLSVTSVFKADFNIEERKGEGIVTGVLQVWKPDSVVIHEMENHLGLFQSSRYNCLKSGIFILLCGIGAQRSISLSFPKMG